MFLHSLCAENCEICKELKNVTNTKGRNKKEKLKGKGYENHLVWDGNNSFGN